MTLKNKNPWKYLSVGLLGVIAIGLFAPVQAAPGGAQSGWQAVADGLQSQIDAIVGDDFQGQIDDLETDLTTHTSADDDLDSTNELQTISGTGSVDLSNSGGSVSCADITGDASLCDSDDANTTYDGTDFATSGQSCTAGQVVTGVSASGAVTCATDKDTNTTYSGANFATSGQSCTSGQVVTGVSASGAVTCAADKDTVLPSRYGVQGSKSIPANSIDKVPLSCDAGDDISWWTFNVGDPKVDFYSVSTTVFGSTESVEINFINRDTSSAHTAFGALICFDLGTAHVP